MEKGRLHWPSSEDGRVQLTREEFALLIGGIDLSDHNEAEVVSRATPEKQVKYRESRMNTGDSRYISTAVI